MTQVENVRVRVTPDGRVSRVDAAAFLGLSPKTLADWKLKGIGPQSRKIGGRVFYDMAALQSFVAAA